MTWDIATVSGDMAVPRGAERPVTHASTMRTLFFRDFFSCVCLGQHTSNLIPGLLGLLVIQRS